MGLTVPVDGSHERMTATMVRPSVEMVSLQLDEVVVIDRHRSDLGDLESLAASISEVGLINPITVTPDRVLVAGHRRLEACRLLGRPLIRATVVRDLDTAQLRLAAERDENSCRLEMRPSESVSLGMALEELERPKAAERKATTQAQPGQRVGEVKFTAPIGKHPQVRDIVGPAVGMSGPTYQRAKAVVVAARDGMDCSGNPLPEHVVAVAKQALAAMDATGKVTPAYNKIAAANADDAAKNKEPDAPTSPDKSRDAVAVRWAKVAELAASAHTSRQIAKKVGIGLPAVRAGAKARGIVVHADAVAGHHRTFDSARVVESTVLDLDASASSLRAIDIDFTQFEMAQITDWVTSLKQSLSALTRFKNQLENQLKEMTQ